MVERCRVTHCVSIDYYDVDHSTGTLVHFLRRNFAKYFFSVDDGIILSLAAIKMDNATTPSRRSSRQTTRSVVVGVAARSGSPTSAISALTDTSAAAQQRQRIEDRNNLSLEQLGNVASPLVIE